MWVHESEIVARRQESGSEERRMMVEKEGESDEARWRERERTRDTRGGSKRRIERGDHNGSLETRKIQIINQVRLKSCVSGNKK